MIGMLRVKNEARWIGEVISSIQPHCSQVLVLDDHSTDETPQIAEACGATVFPSPFDGLDESRDKNFLLDRARETGDTWCLHIDGDEILQAGAGDRLRQAMESDAGTCSFRVLYLWDSRTRVRVDGIYGKFRRPSMFRLEPQAKFAGTAYGGNFHCGNVPRNLRNGRTMDLELSLLHLGYMDRGDRIRKWRWYNSCDPNNRNEDCYRHVVQGDVPEVPVSLRLRWAGPLDVRQI